MIKEMKDSGVEWIGEIPETWTVTKVKQLFEIGRGRVISKEELDDNNPFPVYSSQTKENGVLGYIATYDFDYPQLTWTTDGANAGTVFLRRGQYNCTNVCGTLKLKDTTNSLEFLQYVLQIGAPFYKRRDINGYKIMNNEMSVISFPLPSKKEQDNIVFILAPKLFKIDSVISDTQQSIEELKKYKQSLITETVTKGLDKNVEMKDSGVEWIGETPQDWSLAKVNRLFSIEKVIANQTGYDILSVTQNGLKVKDITRNEGQMAADYSKYQIVQPGYFVMNHMDLLTGWVDVAIQEGVTSPDYRAFHARDEEIVCNEFYLYIFQICYMNKIFYGLGQGVSNLGRWRLQTDKFLNFYLPLPPIKEQKEIVAFLNNKLLQINSMLEQKQQLLSELEQYKKSLIYEYVTGKKEV